MPRTMRSAAGLALAAFLLGTGAPVLAQSAANPDGEARLRKLEAEVRALQRQVFPGGDGKYFAPAVIAPAAPTTAPGTPASTPVSDLLTRMDAVEAQIARLTAQSEETANRVSQIEAKMAAAAAAAAPPAAAADPAPAGTAAAPGAANASAAAVAAAPAAMAAVPTAPATAATRPAPAKPVATKPTAQRIAAVQKIEKPATGNVADDEYSYGYRLWEAKFYPEAQQQLRLYVDKYPRDAKISYGRNLLGRAFLDDGKPREAAPWFLQNYQSDKRGARAPDSLLMLAESMRQLGDSSRGCIALAEFSDNYAAEAGGRLKAQYEATRSALKCQ